ncbi:ribose 5-phosphate isomerase A [Stetteria hydrogenophila]
MARCNAKLEAGRGLVERFRGLIEEARVLGVGTGSTVRAALRVLRDEGLLEGRILVASSVDTALELAGMGYRPVMPSVVSGVDFYFDGADEVDPGGNLLKGRGAAMLGEKILASMARVRVYVVTEEKLVDRLGSRRPLPVEAVPWAAEYVRRRLEGMGYRAEYRRCQGKDGPVVTDWGGVVIDVHTGPMEDPRAVEAEVSSIPGVVATGLFIGLTDYVVVAGPGCGYRVLDFTGRRPR